MHDEHQCMISDESQADTSSMTAAAAAAATRYIGLLADETHVDTIKSNVVAVAVRVLTWHQ